MLNVAKKMGESGNVIIRDRAYCTGYNIKKLIAVRGKLKKFIDKRFG